MIKQDYFITEKKRTIPSIDSNLEYYEMRARLQQIVNFPQNFGVLLTCSKCISQMFQARVYTFYHA